MKEFYISLTRDLLGVYLVVTAENEETVRRYLQSEYFDRAAKVWKLPWCAIYTSVPLVPHVRGPIFIEKKEALLNIYEVQP